MNIRKEAILCIVSVLIVTLTILLPLYVAPVEAMDGQANVYVLKISGVGTCWVDNPDDVVQGVKEACTPIGRSRNVPQVLLTYGKVPPYYRATYTTITSWYSYVNIIQTYTNIIIVNAHGEVVPVPSGYSREAWVDKIAEGMYERRLSWVNIAGYPFFYSWHEGATDKTTWGEGGFQRLMSNIERGAVTCWNPTSGVHAEMGSSSAAWTQLSSWTSLSQAKLVELTRPLKKTDFQNYTLLPLYAYNYGGVDYWEGAIIAFAKPGSRLSTSGFGYYVHLGTDQTYDANNNPTNKDRYRAYVATAAALWAEALQGKPNSNVYIDPTGWERHLSLHVNPLVLGSWTDVGGKRYARIAFGLYGTLSRWYNDDSHVFENIVVYTSSQYLEGEENYGKIKMQVQTGQYSTQPLCKNGRDVGIQPITGVPFYDAQTSWMIDGFIFLLGLWPPTEPVALALGGAKLFADWIQLGVSGNTAGVTQPDTWVDFWYTPQAYYTVSGSKYYGEFESVVVIDVSVQSDYGSDWRVIPLNYGFHINTLSGKTIDVYSDLSLAMWMGSGNTVTVFHDDFEDNFDGWTTGDNNAASGYDYWGLIGYDVGIKPSCAWSATVGDNSIYGVSNKQAGSPWPPRYDKDMDSYLRLDLNALKSKAYQSFTLRFQIDHWLESGDFLSLSIYVEDTGWITLKTFTGDSPSWTWYWQSFAMARKTTLLEFRFYSNGDSNVDYGAFIDDVEILGVIPNDAPNNANQDAGNTYASATSIGTGTGYGYLDAEADSEDWYQFSVSSSYQISVTLYSQSNVVFYVEMWDPGNVKMAGPSAYSTSCVTLSAGNWRIRIYVGQGFGSYSFALSTSPYTPPPPVGGCPILYAFNGTSYACEGLLDIHNPDCIDMVTDHTLVSTPQRVHGTYLFQLVEHPQTVSHIDQVKLFALLEDGIQVQLPLASARHSEDGNVLPQLLFSDDWRTDTLGADHNGGVSQSIQLKFVALPPNTAVTAFIFRIEGYNPCYKT